MSSISQGSGGINPIEEKLVHYDSEIAQIDALKAQVDSTKDTAFLAYKKGLDELPNKLIANEKRFSLAREKMGAATSKIARAFSKIAPTKRNALFNKEGLLEAKALLVLKENEYMNAIDFKDNRARILRYEINDLKKEIHAQTLLMAKSDQSLKKELKMINETAKKIGDLEFKFEQARFELLIDRDTYEANMTTIKEGMTEQLREAVSDLKTELSKNDRKRRMPSFEGREQIPYISPEERSYEDQAIDMLVGDPDKNINTHLELCKTTLKEIKKLKNDLMKTSSSAQKRET